MVHKSVAIIVTNQFRLTKTHGGNYFLPLLLIPFNLFLKFISNAWPLTSGHLKVFIFLLVRR